MKLLRVAHELYTRTNTACLSYIKTKDQMAASVALEAFTRIQADKREFRGANLFERVLSQVILAPLSLALRIFKHFASQQSQKEVAILERNAEWLNGEELLNGDDCVVEEESLPLSFGRTLSPSFLTEN